MTRHFRVRQTPALLTALLLTAASSTIAANPAQAASSYHPCPTAAFCMWKNIYRGGDIAYYRASNMGRGVRVAKSFAGQASSLWNRGNFTVRVYATPDCAGSPLVYENIAPGQYVGNLATIGMANAIRSLGPANNIVSPC